MQTLPFRKEQIPPMGIYLNSSSAFGLFRRDCLSTYFIDKSSILKELVPLVESDDYVTENMFEVLYKTAKQYEADIVKSDHYTFSTHEGKQKKQFHYI